jgi:hypothetical protein
MDIPDRKDVFAPLAAQPWGESLMESPPELGDLGGRLSNIFD